jgi:23S rRNA-/tRNA-specific pseudouridylate synthase
VLPAGAAGLRLDQALARALPQYSRARLQGWIEAGAVLVDGRRLRAKDKVLGGEQIEVAARLEADERVAPQAQPLTIVHEDRALFVINKPAGMVVHPGAGNRGHTLQNALLALDPHARSPFETRRCADRARDRAYLPCDLRWCDDRRRDGRRADRPPPFTADTHVSAQRWP